MPLRMHRSRIASLAVTLFVLSIIYTLVESIIAAAPFLERFRWQFHLLVPAAGMLAVIGALGPPGLSRLMLLLRIPIYFLFCYTLPPDPLIPALFALSTIQEAGFRHGIGWSTGITAATVAGILVTVLPDRTVFSVPVEGLDRVGLMVFTALVLPAAVLAQTMRWAMTRESRWRDTVHRLDMAVFRLAEANLGYQGYAQEVRSASVADERRRISRDIHDTVGYSLTNIRVMLEAASLRMDRSPDETRQLIGQSIDEAGICLEQTRQAMRQLRGREFMMPSGVSAIQRLVRAFSDVTGISVEAEYGNVTVNWPKDVEKTVYRLVQEGMTNAFRHGMATEIMIYLWQDADMLRLIIRDNGSGSGEIKEGLGITGMRERVGSLGGDLEVGPRPDGFEVRARLPLPEEETVDKNPAG